MRRLFQVTAILSQHNTIQHKKYVTYLCKFKEQSVLVQEYLLYNFCTKFKQTNKNTYQLKLYKEKDNTKCKLWICFVLKFTYEQHTKIETHFNKIYIKNVKVEGQPYQSLNSL